METNTRIHNVHVITAFQSALRIKMFISGLTDITAGARQGTSISFRVELPEFTWNSPKKNSNEYNINNKRKVPEEFSLPTVHAGFPPIRCFSRREKNLLTLRLGVAKLL